MAENHVKRRGIQGLPKPVSQSVETSQIIPNSEKAPILLKLPFGLPISPKEFCVLKDKVYQNNALHSQRATSRKNKLTRDES